MTPTAWALLLGTWVVGLVSPGPDFIAVLRASMVGGRRAGSAVAVGIASMLVLWISLALTGISVVVTQHETAFRVMRAVGAVVLVGYGAWILWHVWRDRAAGGGAVVVAPGSDRAGSRWWWTGVVTNASNPKALAFFAALFATLLPQEASVAERGVAGVAMVGSALLWFLFIARVASSGPVVAVYRRTGWIVDALLGVLLVVVGVLLFPR